MLAQIIDQQNAINFPRGFGNWELIITAQSFLVKYIININKKLSYEDSSLKNAKHEIQTILQKRKAVGRK